MLFFTFLFHLVFFCPVSFFFFFLLLNLITLLVYLVIILLVWTLIPLDNGLSDTHLHDGIINVFLKLLNRLIFALLKLSDYFHDLPGHVSNPTDLAVRRGNLFVNMQQIQNFVQVILQIFIFHVMLHNKQMQVVNYGLQKDFGIHGSVIFRRKQAVLMRTRNIRDAS